MNNTYYINYENERISFTSKARKIYERFIGAPLSGVSYFFKKMVKGFKDKFTTADNSVRQPEIAADSIAYENLELNNKINSRILEIKKIASKIDSAIKNNKNVDLTVENLKLTNILKRTKLAKDDKDLSLLGRCNYALNELYSTVVAKIGKANNCAEKIEAINTKLEKDSKEFNAVEYINNKNKKEIEKVISSIKPANSSEAKTINSSSVKPENKEETIINFEFTKKEKEKYDADVTLEKIKIAKEKNQIILSEYRTKIGSYKCGIESVYERCARGKYYFTKEELIKNNYDYEKLAKRYFTETELRLCKNRINEYKKAIEMLSKNPVYLEALNTQEELETKEKARKEELISSFKHERYEKNKAIDKQIEKLLKQKEAILKGISITEIEEEEKAKLEEEARIKKEQEEAYQRKLRNDFETIRMFHSM